jgi:L-fucose isomerase-like protein
MADPSSPPEATIHSNRKLPLLMQFPLRPGRITLARFSQARGVLRLVISSGEVLSAPLSFSGTSGVVRFESPARNVVDTLLGEGLEHHLSLTYGDHVASLSSLAKMLDIPVMKL